MKKNIYIIRLLRVKHYIKNTLVFVPLAFTGDPFNPQKMIVCALGMAAFCLLASTIYIINDIKDARIDALHPVKKMRPVACGAISHNEASCYAITCLLGASLILIYIGIHFCIPMTSYVYVVLYFLFSVLYSFGLKNIPILDIVILMSGFLFRIMFGADIAGTYVSSWLYLTVIAGSFYFGLGKRRGELKNVKRENSRKVLEAYNLGFLDKFMYLCLTMALVFYALWAKEYPKEDVVWTVPIVILICMRYSLDVEGASDGDPVEVVWKDKVLIGLITLFLVILFGVLYIL